MKPIKIKPAKGLQGTLEVPGDKSISHRAAILAAMAKGKTRIKKFLFSDDCLVTLRALRALGIKVSADQKREEVVIVSPGYFHAPSSSLFMGESGTSARVLLGILSAQPFRSILTAAPSLSKRPMARVIEPLRRMGASIEARKSGKDEFLPVKIFPSVLHGIEWKQKIPSAQVKSAILLAGCYARGGTTVIEPVVSRDHTERMLKIFKVPIRIQSDRVRVRRGIFKTPFDILVPGDISSAAFFIVAGLLVKNSKLLIKNVGINPTRAGVIQVLKRMGGKIKVMKKAVPDARNQFEPVADILVETSILHSTIIKRPEIPSLIDELPVLMVAASLAKGRTIIEGAGELRVKEADRINSMRWNLTKLGVPLKVKSLKKTEVLEITGIETLKGAGLKSFCDHRTAMSMVIAALAAEGESVLDDTICMDKSFPGFLATLKHLLIP